MKYQVLGPLRVLDEDRTVELRGVMAARLLCLLLAGANRHTTVEEIVDVLWPARPPRDPRRAIHSLLRRLGPAVAEGAIEREPTGILLHIDQGAIDAHRFESAAERGRALLAGGDPARAGEVFATALALWQGDPYPELASHPRVLAEVGRLEQLHRRVLEDRTGILLSQPFDYELVADLEALTARYPERERLWRQLALALYRIGRQVEALRTFTRCRQVFGAHEVLSGASIRLERAIARQDPALANGELDDA